MVEQVIGIVFPVFAIVLVGYVYGRWHRPDLGAVNRINIDVFVPALIFAVLAGKPIDLADYQWLLLGGAFVVLMSGVLVWPLVRLMGWQSKTFIPPVMFTNSGNMGLPLVLFAFGEQALPAAVLLFIVENTLHFTVGMKMMDRSASMLQIFRMPMLLATIAGIAVSVLGVTVPPAIYRPIDMIGQIAIPFMLFALGVRLVSVELRDWKIGVVSAIVTPATGLLLAAIYMMWIELPAQQVSLLILFGALPPAVLNFMVAEKYQQEPSTVASIVMLGNLGSVVVIPSVLYFILPH